MSTIYDAYSQWIQSNLLIFAKSKKSDQSGFPTHLDNYENSKKKSFRDVIESCCILCLKKFAPNFGIPAYPENYSVICRSLFKIKSDMRTQRSIFTTCVISLTDICPQSPNFLKTGLPCILRTTREIVLNLARTYYLRMQCPIYINLMLKFAGFVRKKVNFAL